jgi:hypothetical protein
LAIKGIGQIKCIIGNNTLIIDNIWYFPSLAESIYSLFLHIKQQHHGVQSSFDKGLHLKFPNFTTKTIVGHDDIYLDTLPHPDNHTTDDSTFFMATTSNVTEPRTCHHTTIQDNTMETTKNNNLLKSLRQYYSEVKMK